MKNLVLLSLRKPVAEVQGSFAAEIEGVKLVVKLLRGSLHQDGHRVGKQGPHRHSDQDSDEDGADGIGDHPTESPHQDSRDDHPGAAKCVGQDMKENTLNKD